MRPSHAIGRRGAVGRPGRAIAAAVAARAIGRFHRRHHAIGDRAGGLDERLHRVRHHVAGAQDVALDRIEDLGAGDLSLHVLRHIAVGESRVTGAAALQVEDAELPALERRILAEHLDDAFRIGALLAAPRRRASGSCGCRRRRPGTPPRPCRARPPPARPSGTDRRDRRRSPTRSPRARWRDRRRSPTTWRAPMTGRKKQCNQGNSRARFMGAHLKALFVLIMALCSSARFRVGADPLGLGFLAAVPASAQSPTFAKDVAPIFYSKCVECHRPTMFAPMSLVKYEDARPWARSIRNRVATRTMPPWGADPSHGIVQERSAAHRQGDRDHPRVGRCRRAERRRQRPAGRAEVRRGRLDHRQARRRVRDEGSVQDPGARHDRISVHPHPDRHHRRQWLQAIEIKPQARAHVHHVIAFTVPAGSPISEQGALGPGNIGGVTPNKPGVVFEPASAACSPAIPTSCCRCTTPPTAKRPWTRRRSGWCSRRNRRSGSSAAAARWISASRSRPARRRTKCAARACCRPTPSSRRSRRTCTCAART